VAKKHDASKQIIDIKPVRSRKLEIAKKRTSNSKNTAFGNFVNPVKRWNEKK
jgi:hypothetical protein